MIKITKRQYRTIDRDYKGTFEYPGKGRRIRGAFENSVLAAVGLPITGDPCAVVFEGIHFEIIENKNGR